jgi:large subunit ribosomal protein L16
MLVPRRSDSASSTTRPPRRREGGTRLAFGDYGIQSLESAYLTNRQIESPGSR